MSSLSLAAQPSVGKAALDQQPSSALLDAVMADIIAILNRELNARGLGSTAARRELWQALTQSLIQVQDLPNGLRRVSICQDRSVFLIPVCSDALPSCQDLYPAGRAIGLCARPNDIHPFPQFWQGLSPSQWRSTMQAWLMHTLAGWLRPLGTPPGMDHLTVVSQIALSAVSVVDSHYGALQWLVMDALGYPRALVRNGYRNHHRNLPAVTADRQIQLIQHWPVRTKWYGRALKLFPLALALVEGDTPPPDPLTTRNALLQYGLSRNAWALFYRLPSPIISLIADDLRLFSDEQDRSRYLQHLSLWCSRLGPELKCARPSQYRPYASGITIYRKHVLHPLPCQREKVLRLMFALVWPVKELTLLKSVRAVRLYATDQLDHGLTIRLYGMTQLTLLRHRNALEEHHDRLAGLLLSFSRYLLHPSNRIDPSFSILEDLLDWFRHEGVNFPVQFFKQPFPILRRLSDRWHADQRGHRRASAEEHEFPSSWTATLPLFEREGARFEALLTQDELVEEGRFMQHCVANYADACAAQRSQIYAVSFQEQRVGTLELCRVDGRWHVTQFKGLKNLNLMDALTHPESLLHSPFQHFLAALTSASAES
jgi:hypothetical protein